VSSWGDGGTAVGSALARPAYPVARGLLIDQVISGVEAASELTDEA
jgi:hypothetical protein